MIYFGGGTVKLLKKSELTLNYTFFSAQGKSHKKIIGIDALREDGIAELLLDMGRISEREYEFLMKLYDDS